MAKFKKETENLLLNDWPLGGTILSPSTGKPDAPSARDTLDFSNTFPNRLVSLELKTYILELIDQNPELRPTMTDVKDLIERAIQQSHVIQKVKNKSKFQKVTLNRQERVSVRKMMSRYWENPSIFALELGGAVIRQSVFIDKMLAIDWLHSPAARKTMNRLLLKYSRFIQIISTYSLHTAVPTLDVDLGWHTHQLSPKSYYDYVNGKCKKFIDHDDKIDEDTLSIAFEWTSKTYEKLFQEVYSECTCWYCEGKVLFSFHNLTRLTTSQQSAARTSPHPRKYSALPSMRKRSTIFTTLALLNSVHPISRPISRPITPSILKKARVKKWSTVLSAPSTKDS